MKKTIEQIQEECNKNAIAAVHKMLKTPGVGWLHGCDTPAHPIKNERFILDTLIFDAYINHADGIHPGGVWGYAEVSEPVRTQHVTKLKAGKGPLLYIKTIKDNPGKKWEEIRDIIYEKTGKTAMAVELRRALLCSGLIDFSSETKTYSITQLGEDLLNAYGA